MIFHHKSLEKNDYAKFREQSIKKLKAQIKDIEDAFENNELGGDYLDKKQKRNKLKDICKG